MTDDELENQLEKDIQAFNSQRNATTYRFNDAWFR